MAAWQGQAWGRQRVQWPSPQPKSPAPHHHLQRGLQRQAPVLCSVHYSLELLRQGPDLRKVRPLA